MTQSDAGFWVVQAVEGHRKEWLYLKGSVGVSIMESTIVMCVLGAS